MEGSVFFVKQQTQCVARVRNKMCISRCVTNSAQTDLRFERVRAHSAQGAAVIS